jgi:transcriptional regulator with XRE-family HTH domain
VALTRDEWRPADPGARLKAVRELAGVDQRTAAREAGLSRRELDAAERGRRRLSNAELDKLAAALRVEPDVLAVRENDWEFGRPLATPPDGPPRPARDRTPRPDHDVFAALDELGARADLPHGERRRDHLTRARLEASWQIVHNEMEEVLMACSALTAATAGDDAAALLRELEASIERVWRKRSFLRHAVRHQRELARARGRTAPTPSGDDPDYERAPAS